MERFALFKVSEYLVRIRHRSIVILVSQGLTQISTILLAAILVRMISQDLFGTYRQVLLVHMFISGLVSFQIDAGLYYFIPKTDPAQRGRLVSQIIIASLLTALPGVIAMYFSAGWVAHLFKNPELEPLLRCFCLYFIPERILLLVPAFMISVDRAARAGVYTLMMAVGRIGAVALTLGAGLSLLTSLWATILVIAVMALFGMLDMTRIAGKGSWSPDGSVLRDVFGYAWPLWGTAVVAVVNLQLGSALISTFFDPATFAVYSCGAMELPVVALITGSMTSAVMPNLVVYFSQGQRDAALGLWHEAARKCSLVIMPCFAFCLLAAEPIMVFLYGADYARAAWPFAVYLFALPLRVAVYSALLRAMNRTRKIMLAALLALVVNAVGSLALLVLFQGSGLAFVAPAIGAVMAQFVSGAYLLQQIRANLDLRWSQVMRWRELGGILAVSLVCGGLTWATGHLLPGTPPLLRLTLLGSVYAGLFLASLWALRMLRSDEIDMAMAPVRALRKRWSSGSPA